MKTVVRGVALALLHAIGPSVSAQWPAYKVPGVPRNADGTVNLDAPAPRAPDGKPDLSGIWENFPPPEQVVQSVNTGFTQGQRTLRNESRDVATGVIRRSKADTLADLKNLAPLLRELANSGDNLA